MGVIVFFGLFFGYNFLNKNDGISGNTNEALKLATGDYIGIVEPDDFVKKQMFEDLYKIAIIKTIVLHLFHLELYQMRKKYGEYVQSCCN